MRTPFRSPIARRVGALLGAGLALVMILHPHTLFAEEAISEAEARAAVSRFLDALERLDAEAFVAAFSQDATIFYPQPGAFERIDGRQEIRTSIRPKFEATRRYLAEAGRTEPPFLGIEPLEMKVQILCPEIAVVTWRVDRGTHGGRRTAVVHHTDDGWRIASLHSSNMPYEEE